MNIGDDKELIGYADSKNMEWQEYRPGSRSKILREDTRSGQLTMLARWDPGYRMAEVEHPDQWPNATRARSPFFSRYSSNLLRRFDVVATRQPLFRKAARVTRLGLPSLEMHNRADTRCQANDIAPRRSRTIARRSKAVFLMFVQMLVLAASAGGCASLRFNPDPEVAPSGNVDRVWTAPRSISDANEAASKLEPLRSLEQSNALRTAGAQAYDLPALVDLALRTNPQTRRAWYAAQAADAQLGQSQAANYPKIAAEGEGGYLKLPIQFPGQTLVIRNEAFLPQIKVSYDLLDFGRTRAARARRARAAHRRELRLQSRDPGRRLQRRKSLLRPLRREGERQRCGGQPQACAYESRRRPGTASDGSCDEAANPSGQAGRGAGRLRSRERQVHGP